MEATWRGYIHWAHHFLRVLTFRLLIRIIFNLRLRLNHLRPLLHYPSCLFRGFRQQVRFQSIPQLGCTLIRQSSLNGNTLNEFMQWGKWRRCWTVNQLGAGLSQCHRLITKAAIGIAKNFPILFVRIRRAWHVFDHFLMKNFVWVWVD